MVTANPDRDGKETPPVDSLPTIREGLVQYIESRLNVGINMEPKEVCKAFAAGAGLAAAIYNQAISTMMKTEGASLTPDFITIDHAINTDCGQLAMAYMDITQEELDKQTEDQEEITYDKAGNSTHIGGVPIPSTIPLSRGEGAEPIPFTGGEGGDGTPGSAEDSEETDEQDGDRIRDNADGGEEDGED